MWKSYQRFPAHPISSVYMLPAIVTITIMIIILKIHYNFDKTKEMRGWESRYQSSVAYILLPYFFFPFLLHHHKMISVFHSIGIKSRLLSAKSFTYCFTIGPPFSLLSFLHTLQHYLDFPFLFILSLCYFFPSDPNPIIYSFFLALFPWRAYTYLWPQLLAPWKWSLITPLTLICTLIIRFNFVMFNDC